MAWDFETDPEFQRDLDWMDECVREEIEPLDFILGHPNDFTDPKPVSYTHLTLPTTPSV